MLRHLPFLIALMASLGGPASAERELHVVSVFEGTPDPADRWRVPVARVMIDRPGHDIVLILADRGPLRWEIDLTPGTSLEQVYLGGANPDSSEVRLGGIPVVASVSPGLPVTLQPEGRKFRAMVTVATDLAEIDALGSFQGYYTAGARPIRVDRTEDREDYARSYPEAALSDDADLPIGILDPGPPPAEVLFDPGGMVLRRPGEHALRLPRPPDMTPPLLPSGATFDAASGAVFGLAIGGAGAVYRVDVSSGDWTVLASLDGYDGAALIFDPATGRIVMTGAFARPGEIRVLGPSGQMTGFTIPVTGFAALTDLYDHGNEDAPPLRPVAIDGDWVRLEASEIAGGTAKRSYALNLASREVRLIDFVNGW